MVLVSFDLRSFLTLPRLIEAERPGPRRALLIESSPEYAGFLVGEQRKTEADCSEHEYDLTAHASVRARARAELRDLFERYGWEA